ncbi:MAG: hypothetical protein AAGE52_00720 [Myxococcota bacterium]
MPSPFRKAAHVPNANADANDAIDEAIAASRSRRLQEQRRVLRRRVIGSVLACGALVGLGLTFSLGTGETLAVALLGGVFFLLYSHR